MSVTDTIKNILESSKGVQGTMGPEDSGLGGIIPKPIEPTVANSVEATLAQRGSRYGDFTDHAELCQKLKDAMMTMSVPDNGGMLAWNKLSDVQKQALEVIMDKVARILTGDPNYDDNWHDIQGYAKLVEDRLPKKEVN